MYELNFDRFKLTNLTINDNLFMVLSRIIFIAVNLISDLSAKEWEMTGRSIAMPMVFCDFDVSVPSSSGGAGVTLMPGCCYFLSQGEQLSCPTYQETTTTTQQQLERSDKNSR